MRNKDEPSTKDGPRITQQFRDRGGMAYDFSVQGASFTVRVFPRENASDPADWRVEVRAKRTEHGFVVTAWGPTRAEALREAGRSWAADPLSHELPQPDWSVVEKALQTVRAV